MRQGLHFSHSAETVDQLRSKDPSTLTDQEKMILSIAYDLVFTFEHILTLRRGLTPLFILISFLLSSFSRSPSIRKTNNLAATPAQAEKSAHRRGTTGEAWKSAAAKDNDSLAEPLIFFFFFF